MTLRLLTSIEWGDRYDDLPDEKRYRAGWFAESGLEVVEIEEGDLRIFAGNFAEGLGCHIQLYRKAQLVLEIRVMRSLMVTEPRMVFRELDLPV